MALSIFHCFSYFLIVSTIIDAETLSAREKSTSIKETTISLVDYDSSNPNGQVFYHSVTLLPNDDSSVDITDIPNNVSFIVIQIHTHEKNVTLSYNDGYDKSNGSVFGSNIGLLIEVGGNTTARMIISNNWNTSTDALIAAVVYTDLAPTPGGCNLEFDIEVSPFQKLYITEATVIVQAQLASAPPKNGKIPSCENNPVELTAYRLYLPERDFTSKTYFDGLRKMMTVQDIIKNGQKIPPPVGGSLVRRVFSAYPGTGSVYAMIATYGNYSSAYVPTASYACNPVSSSTSCGNLNTTIGQALCAIILAVGFLITFIGHKCLGFEVVFLGAICGGIISYSALTAIGYFETTTVLGIVMGVSALSGIGSLVMSYCIGMPCIATFLASMTLGFFVASTVYFGIADDTPLFESDLNFWLIYAGVALLVPLVLAVLPFSSNVVCCAILGSYSIILPIDYYAGSNLKYIVINTVRRATVPNFNVAVIQPPYQGTDKCLVAFLIIIALLGIYVQVGRICFCCKAKSLWQTTISSEERQPVLSASRRGRRILVFGETDHVQSNW